MKDLNDAFEELLPILDGRGMHLVDDERFMLLSSSLKTPSLIKLEWLLFYLLMMREFPLLFEMSSELMYGLLISSLLNGFWKLFLLPNKFLSD